MKNNYLLLFYLLLFINLSIKAQKVDLDREYVEVKYLRLPSNPIIKADERTFTFNSNDDVTENEIKLYGFNRINNNGKITASIIYQPILIKEVKIKDIVRTEKDKEGKVIKTTKTYQPIINYVTNAYFKYNNPVDNAIKGWNLGEKQIHKGKEYSKYKDAYDFYKLNENNLRDTFQDNFINKCIGITNKFLNTNFGYVPYSINELFWILDSESNPEYKDHKKALEDIKTLLSKLKEDTNVTSLKPDVEKLATYFNSVIPKFPKDKKRHRKMRYASYYNSAKLYYQFDMLDKAIEYANKVIENDYDKKDGKRIIKKSNRLKELFKVNKVTTRRFKTETKDSRTFDEPIAVTEPKVIVIENKVIPKVKPITSLKLTGNSEIDNKIVSNLLDELELIQVIKNRKAIPFKGEYLKEGGKITGKKLHLLYGDTRYNTINLIYFNNKVIGTKKGETESQLIFNSNNTLKKINEKYLGSDKTSNSFSIARGSHGKIISVKKFYQGVSSDLSETTTINYKDKNISLITIDMHRRRDDKILIKIIENTNNKHLSTVKNLSRKYHEDITSYEVIKESPLVLKFNLKITYKEKHKIKPFTINRVFNYTDFGKILTKEESSLKYEEKTNKEIKFYHTYVYKYDKQELLKFIRVTKNFHNPKDSFKMIHIYKDLQKKSNDAPEYKWRKGRYELNHEGELIFIGRDSKHKKKINGQWTGWKYNSY